MKYKASVHVCLKLSVKFGHALFSGCLMCKDRSYDYQNKWEFKETVILYVEY